MTPRLRNIAVDCNDLSMMVRFWTELLDYEVLGEDEDSALIAPAPEARPRIFFQRVPEPRLGKNRLHIDLDVGDGDLDEGVRRAESVGARRQEFFEEGGPGYGWWVLSDPEGNLFCIGRLPD